MSWLIISICSYFLLAVVALVDKYLLGRALVSPKMYAFYVGVGGILVLVFVPFGFFLPEPSIIIFALLAGIFHILGIFITFKAIQLFEVSRVIPAIGGFLPLFVFGLTYILPIEKEIFSQPELLSFFLLILGSVIITWERSKTVSLQSLKTAALAAFLLAFFFVLAKFVYLSHPFISGLIWTRIGAFLAAIALFFTKELREELFEKREALKMKTLGILIPNQVVAVGAFLLQSWAVALVPLSSLAFVNALEGTRYVFLLIFAVFLSLAKPLWAKKTGLKEDVSRKVILQKIIAILLIGGGLVLLAL
jgi:drug/metabolite transporter (DMT)-like permease